MKTVTIQIGNSDDKLTQRQWSDFVEEISSLLSLVRSKVHFHATSPGDEPWQNAAWVIEELPIDLPRIKSRITEIRQQYGQESATWTEGETEFI